MGWLAEMEAQGTIAQINMMLKMINKGDYIVIDTIDTKKDIPLEGNMRQASM